MPIDGQNGAVETVCANAMRTIAVGHIVRTVVAGLAQRVVPFRREVIGARHGFRVVLARAAAGMFCVVCKQTKGRG